MDTFLTFLDFYTQTKELRASLPDQEYALLLWNTATQQAINLISNPVEEDPEIGYGDTAVFRSATQQD